ncbi:MAG: hypothetical protein ACTSPY_00630 [Candidatus Helarchaeota archaeon]
MIILLIGKNEFDSGKTTFGRIITKLFRNRNLNIIPFKPHSGFNYWYNYSLIDRYLNFKDFYSKDIYLLLNELNNSIDINPLILNPVHRVLGPSKKLFNESYFDEFFFIRFSKWDEKTKNLISEYYFNNFFEGITKITNRIKELYKNKIIGEIKTVKELEILYNKNFSVSIKTCFSYLIRNFDHILIESFNDAAYPFENIEKFIDLIFLVSPGKVFLIDKEKYFKSCFLKATIQSPLLLTVKRVIEKSFIINELEYEPIDLTRKLNKEEVYKIYKNICDFIFSNL